MPLLDTIVNLHVCKGKQEEIQALMKDVMTEDLGVLVGMIRSSDRKSFGRFLRRELAIKFEESDPSQLYFMYRYGKPNLREMIHWLHPRPKTPQHAAVFGLVTRSAYADIFLPKDVRVLAKEQQKI